MAWKGERHRHSMASKGVHSFDETELPMPKATEWLKHDKKKRQYTNIVNGLKLEHVKRVLLIYGYEDEDLRYISSTIGLRKLLVSHLVNREITLEEVRRYG